MTTLTIHPLSQLFSSLKEYPPMASTQTFLLAYRMQCKFPLSALVHQNHRHPIYFITIYLNISTTCSGSSVTAIAATFTSLGA